MQLVRLDWKKSKNHIDTRRRYCIYNNHLPLQIKPLFRLWICQISGEWKGATAGGCGNHQATYRNNPKCKLEISGATESKILVELKGPKQYQVGFDITIKSLEDDSVTAPFRTTSSGSYRSGFVILELDNIPAGCLIITPTTFLPGQEGPFILTVKSSSPIQLSLY